MDATAVARPAARDGAVVDPAVVEQQRIVGTADVADRLQQRPPPRRAGDTRAYVPDAVGAAEPEPHGPRRAVEAAAGGRPYADQAARDRRPDVDRPAHPGDAELDPQPLAGPDHVEAIPHEQPETLPDAAGRP